MFMDIYRYLLHVEVLLSWRLKRLVWETVSLWAFVHARSCNWMIPHCHHIQLLHVAPHFWSHSGQCFRSGRLIICPGGDRRRPSFERYLQGAKGQTDLNKQSIAAIPVIAVLNRKWKRKTCWDSQFLGVPDSPSRHNKKNVDRCPFWEACNFNIRVANTTLMHQFSFASDQESNIVGHCCSSPCMDWDCLFIHLWPISGIA